MRKSLQNEFYLKLIHITCPRPKFQRDWTCFEYRAPQNLISMLAARRWLGVLRILPKAFPTTGKEGDNYHFAKDRNHIPLCRAKLSHWSSQCSLLGLPPITSQNLGDRTDTMLNLLLFVAVLIVGCLWCRVYNRSGQIQGMFIIFIPVKSRAYQHEDNRRLTHPVDAATRRLEGNHGEGKPFVLIRAPPLLFSWRSTRGILPFGA